VFLVFLCAGLNHGFPLLADFEFSESFLAGILDENAKVAFTLEEIEFVFVFLVAEYIHFVACFVVDAYGSCLQVGDVVTQLTQQFLLPEGNHKGGLYPAVFLAASA